MAEHNKSNSFVTRRDFLRTSASCAAATVAMPALGSDGKAPASDRITIGMIGVGRQAKAYNLSWFLKSPEIQVVAVCDVDAWRLNNAVETVNAKEKGVAAYKDFHELLARKDIDAVMISTPDHWHVPMAVAAVQEGKDVCCEKPITKIIAEGRLLVDEVAKHERIFRVDSEARFKTTFCHAAEAVRNGRIGKLVRMEVGVPIDNARCGIPPSTTEPEELDFNMWLGPAPLAAYTENRVHPHQAYSRGGWMRVRDYDDGMITNWGAHLIDIAYWRADLERTRPVRIEGKGVFRKNELWNAMQDFVVNYEYANGVKLTVKTVKGHYTRFIGESGWVEAGFSRIKASDPEVLEVGLGKDKIRLSRKDEKQDFIDCVKLRARPIADAEVGHHTNSVGLLGVIAAELGKPLQWDPANEKFPTNSEANKRLERSMRRPFTLS